MKRMRQTTARPRTTQTADHFNSEQQNTTTQTTVFPSQPARCIPLPKHHRKQLRHEDPSPLQEPLATMRREFLTGKIGSRLEKP